MTYLTAALVLLAGVLLGAFVARLLTGARRTPSPDQTAAERDTQLATLTERLAARDRQIEELKESQARQTTQIAELTAQCRQTDAQRAAAEQQAQLIPPLQAQLARREGEIKTLNETLAALNIARSELEVTVAKEREAHAAQLALLNEAKQQLSDAFKALSADALKSNNQSFLELARSTLEKFQETARGDLDRRQVAIDQLVKPIRESLAQFDGKLTDLEKSRVGAYEGLTQQVRALLDTQKDLRAETANLVKALGTPRVRGRWGEMQLRRVVEIAGMLDHCDFEEQISVTTTEGRLRPDLIVHLPGGKTVVVDAKAPLAGYLEALEATDDATRQHKLSDHARHIREHMTALSRKSYWEQFEAAPEFVILFLPGETFFSAALEQDPALIELGVEQRVILATPTTLITLLKAVAYGWRQETLAAHAREICDLGKELYKRIADLSGHFAEVGARLDKAVESYNKAVGTLETRVLVSARRFHELESAGAEATLKPLPPVDIRARQLQAPELRPEPPAAASA